MNGRRKSVALIAVTCIAMAGSVPAHARAQTGFHNTDAGRPVRVEDATPTERHEIELLLPSVRLEHLPRGTYRLRAEPKLAYGVLPSTEIELRLPIVYRERALVPRGGISGLGVGAMHNFHIESLHLPAISGAVDLLLPVGSASSPGTSQSAKLLLTRTLRIGRLHLNGAYGRFNVRRPVPADAALCGIACVVIPPDLPCFRIAATPAGPSGSARPSTVTCASTFGGTAAARATDASSNGNYWLLGLAFDRAIALRSLLLTADVYAERFGGLGRPADWTAEAGARKQLGPQTVADAGVGYRFSGTTRSSFVTVGMSYAFAVRQPIRIDRGPRRHFEQTWLPSRHNWAFRDHYRNADRLFNGFDYGHAILYEELYARPATAVDRLERVQFDFITRDMLRDPPRNAVDESTVGPSYVRLVPEIALMFEWAHMLHRQVYDVWSDERIPVADKDARIADLLRYYRSRPDLAFSSMPKGMELMEGQYYSRVFRERYPRFNGLIWSYHWLQMGLYDALMEGGDRRGRTANVAATIDRFWRMLDGAQDSLPSVMPMSAAVAPLFTARYPEASIIFDNLHSLHDVVSDVLASPNVPRGQKREALLRAAAAYRDSSTSVTTVEDWLAMSRAMGTRQMGGAAREYLPVRTSPGTTRDTAPVAPHVHPPREPRLPHPHRPQ